MSIRSSVALATASLILAGCSSTVNTVSEVPADGTGGAAGAAGRNSVTANGGGDGLGTNSSGGKAAQSSMGGSAGLPLVPGAGNASTGIGGASTAGSGAVPAGGVDGATTAGGAALASAGAHTTLGGVAGATASSGGSVAAGAGGVIPLATAGTAGALIARRVLTIQKLGNGTGTVVSADNALNCGTTCSASIVDGDRVTLTATASSESDFSAWTGCDSAIGSSCSVAMNSDRGVTAKFDAAPTYGLTITTTKLDVASGTVTVQIGSAAAVDCSSGCTLRVRPSTQVRLNATATQLYFGGWSGRCASAGFEGACTIPSLLSDTTVGATFSAANVAFVTQNGYFYPEIKAQATDSSTEARKMLSGGDKLCGDEAKAAGLPGQFRAWLLSTAEPATSRLGDARGWIRVDGTPYADILPSYAIYYPVTFDARGVSVPSNRWYVVTGASTAGVNENCNDWADIGPGSTARTLGGTPFGVGSYWTYLVGDYLTCDVNSPGYQKVSLLCLGVDRKARVAAPTPAAPNRMIFVSSKLFDNDAGLAAADAQCQADADATLTLAGRTFKAMLATSTGSIASRFANASLLPVVRPDGATVCASQAQLFQSSPNLLTGINVLADGTYISDYVMIGANTLTEVPAKNRTCQDWSSNLVTEIGLGSRYQVDMASPNWTGCLNFSCDYSRRIYCLEAS